MTGFAEAIMTTARSSPARPTWVYLLCRQGNPVYVGITSNPGHRLETHRQTKTFDEVRLSEPMERHVAARVEAGLIRLYRPPLNEVHAFPNREEVFPQRGEADPTAGPPLEKSDDPAVLVGATGFEPATPRPPAL